jgi:hypothetical protein
MIFLKCAALAFLGLTFALLLIASINGARFAVMGYDRKGEPWSDDNTIDLCIIVLLLILTGGVMGSLIESML